jgi:hypothetical protein
MNMDQDLLNSGEFFSVSSSLVNRSCSIFMLEIIQYYIPINSNNETAGSPRKF